MRIVGILLAAGRGTRFGADKRLARLADGQAVALAACRNLLAAVPEVVAVVRPGDDALAADLTVAGAKVIRCADADGGMGRTLACGVGATPDADEGLPDQFAKLLYSMSSVLPEAIREGAQREGFPVSEASRGFAFNADLVELIRFLDIGTRPSNLR